MRWWKKNYNAKALWHLLLWFAPVSAFSQQGSVLATGDWFKIGVTATGVYKLDAAYFRKAGIDIRRVPADQVQIFGNGSGILPQANATPRPADLLPVAIEVETGNAGTTEAVYFYGEGPTRVLPDETGNRYRHEVNPYTDTTFYFLTFQHPRNIRIQVQNNPVPANPAPVQTFEDYWYYEKDAVNLLRSGREWWGDYLGTTNLLNLEIDLPGLVQGREAVLGFGAIAAAQVPTKFRWQTNGRLIGEETAGTVSTYRYDLKAQKVAARYTFAPDAGEKIKLTLTYDKSGQPGATAYLNQVSLQTSRSLRAFATPTIYRFPAADTKNRILAFSDLPEDFLLWDISNPLLPSQISLHKKGTNESWAVPASAGWSGSLIGFTKKQALVPLPASKIPNQDIHSSPVPDMIIVTAEEWLTEAERLADFRQSNDGLKVATFTTRQVYNEFASGKPDVTAIRDLCRYFYQREPGRLKYLLLLGDATYDFRNKELVYSPQQRDSWVPSYQSRESLHPVYTYASDDYFALLDDDAGEWPEEESGDHLLQIGVGRLPVKNKKEAALVVQKLIDYATTSVRTPWRNKITFVADNGDSNIHQQHADALATIVSENFLAARVFTDEFPLLATALGNRAPVINKEIGRKINEGSLILNFTGHGNESGWTDEQILTLADMQSAAGYNNMPVLVTATCEFGRYDNPAVVSGAELMLLSPRGAGIGAMTTTRPVFSSTNFAINKAFYQTLLSGMSRLGDIFRTTKNGSFAGPLNRNFTLLGDPSMKLALPEKGVRLKSDTLRPLEMAVLEGEIFDPETGHPDPAFNGIAEITLFGALTRFETLGAISPPATYHEYRDRLFSGTATVSGGRFTLRFRVPDSDLKELQTGVATVYARTNDSQADAGALIKTFIAPRKSPPSNDTTAPVVQAFLNDSTFRNNQEVPANPTLFVKISDDAGLTMSGERSGCRVSAVLDDTLEIPVTEYYRADTDVFQTARVEMPLHIESEGSHRLTLSFCDVAGNKTATDLTFRIRRETGLKLKSTVLFPNPFRDQLTYRLTHNRPGQDLEVRFRIFSRDGRLLFENEFTFYNAPSVVSRTVLPFTKIKPETQLYLYDLTVRSLGEMTVDRVSGKLIHRD